MIELGCRVGNVKRALGDGERGMKKVNKRLAGWGTCSVQGGKGEFGTAVDGCSFHPRRFPTALYCY